MRFVAVTWVRMVTVSQPWKERKIAEMYLQCNNMKEAQRHLAQVWCSVVSMLNRKKPIVAPDMLVGLLKQCHGN